MIKSRFCSHIVMGLLMTALAGCFRDEVENFAEEELLIENTVKGLAEADDALEIAYLAQAIERTFENGRLNASVCGVITHDQLNKKVIIQFGDSLSCQGQFSRQRKGTVSVAYSTALADSLSDLNITFENYLVNGQQIEGNVSLHDISFGSDNIQYALRTVEDFTVHFPTGTSVTLNGTHSRKWSSGRGDSIIRNNVYTLSGSINGITGNGRVFTQTITEPVVANYYCASLGNFAYTQGVVELAHVNGYPDRKRLVNFGQGKCDNVISIETYRRTYGLNPK